MDVAIILHNLVYTVVKTLCKKKKKKFYMQRATKTQPDFCVWQSCSVVYLFLCIFMIFGYVLCLSFNVLFG